MRRRRYQSSSGHFRSTTVPQLPNPGTPFPPTILNFDPRKIHNIPPAQGITRALLFIKKICPQKWVKQPIASWCGPFFPHQILHAPMFEQGVHRDFRKILWTRNIIRPKPRKISVVTRLRVHGLYRDYHGPALRHPYDHDRGRPGSLK